MDEIVQLVASEPEDNDEMTVFKIKASNTGLLLEAFKDGRKWHKDSRTECTRFASVSISSVQVVTHFSILNTYFSNKFNVPTVQTFGYKPARTAQLLEITNHIGITEKITIKVSNKMLKNNSCRTLLVEEIRSMLQGASIYHPYLHIQFEVFLRCRCFTIINLTNHFRKNLFLIPIQQFVATIK